MGIATSVARIAALAASRMLTAAMMPLYFSILTAPSVSLVVISRPDCLGTSFRLGGGAASLRSRCGGACDLVSDRARRMAVVARVLVVVRCQPFANFHDGEHAAHLNWSELAEARHHRQRVLGQRHFHCAYIGHARASHGHVVGYQLADLARQIALVDADEVLDVVTHRVHGVMSLVAVECPVAWVVGQHVEGPDRANRDVDGALRPLRA